MGKGWKYINKKIRKWFKCFIPSCCARDEDEKQSNSIELEEGETDEEELMAIVEFKNSQEQLVSVYFPLKMTVASNSEEKKENLFLFSQRNLWCNSDSSLDEPPLIFETNVEVHQAEEPSDCITSNPSCSSFYPMHTIKEVKDSHVELEEMKKTLKLKNTEAQSVTVNCLSQEKIVTFLYTIRNLWYNSGYSLVQTQLIFSAKTTTSKINNTAAVYRSVLVRCSLQDSQFPILTTGRNMVDRALTNKMAPTVSGQPFPRYETRDLCSLPPVDC